jgi:hypothetical protein
LSAKASKALRRDSICASRLTLKFDIVTGFQR